MKVEVGKSYQNIDTGDICKVKELLLFNTCVMIDQDGKEYGCKYSVFEANYEEV
jgi:hypothetical protein